MSSQETCSFCGDTCIKRLDKDSDSVNTCTVSTNGGPEVGRLCLNEYFGVPAKSGRSLSFWRIRSSSAFTSSCPPFLPMEEEGWCSPLEKPPCVVILR